MIYITNLNIYGKAQEQFPSCIKGPVLPGDSIKSWVSRQALWPVNIAITKHIDRLHSAIEINNKINRGRKRANDVASLLKNIYENKNILLTYSKEFQCDNGSEFKSEGDKIV